MTKTNAGHEKVSLMERMRGGYAQLDRRQQSLIGLLILAVAFSFFYNGLYRPQRLCTAAARADAQALERRMEVLRAGLPDLDGQRMRVREAEESLKRAKQELAGMESKLPEQSSLPTLLGELVLLASGMEFDFESIKPVTTKTDTEDYSRLDIRMQFRSSYANYVNYLNRIESMTHFLYPSEMIVEASPEGMQERAVVTLVLSSMLAEEAHAGKLEAMAEGLESVETVHVERDPFKSTLLESGEGEQIPLEVSGIVGRGGKATAIINDEVVRAGDSVGAYTVREILPDRVIVTEGQRTILLTVERD